MLKTTNKEVSKVLFEVLGLPVNRDLAHDSAITVNISFFGLFSIDFMSG